MAGLKSLMLYLTLSFSILTTMAEPVQYCIFGDKAHPNTKVDFCMGLTMHQNTSSNSHDLYLTFEVPRYGGNSLGWTAIGLGETMTGALMFFIYGDPTSYENPIISIRGSTGHHQPKLVTPADMNGADLRVLRSMWMPKTDDFTPDNPTYTATVSLVCYSCNLWPGVPISAFSSSQPWIWAWNSNQDIPVYTEDVHLTMHTHHAGHGGFGSFYIDMARSINTNQHAPSFPPIRSGVAAFGASDSPGLVSWFTHSPLVRAHGMLMGIAFLILFPLGVIAMRSGSSKSFKYHWIIQLVASMFTLFGVIAGLSLGRRIDTVHQSVGITVASFLGIQGILGWRHHVDFLRIRRRTWISYSHIWMGRALMTAGWSNLVTGLVLRGYKTAWVTIMGILVCSEMISLSFWVWWRARRAVLKAASAPAEESTNWRDHQGDNRYFALEGSDGEDDEGLHDVNVEEKEKVESLADGDRRAVDDRQSKGISIAKT